MLLSDRETYFFLEGLNSYPSYVNPQNKIMPMMMSAIRNEDPCYANDAALPVTVYKEIAAENR